MWVLQGLELKFSKFIVMKHRANPEQILILEISSFAANLNR